jgi:hypothetical protein
LSNLGRGEAVASGHRFGGRKPDSKELSGSCQKKLWQVTISFEPKKIAEMV